MKNKPRIAMNVRHIESGGYYVVESFGMLKIAKAKWEDSVNYRKAEEPDGILFTRTAADFSKEFEEV